MNDETSPAYHAGMRALQDRFDTRRLADRLDEKLARRDFSDEDRAFIETRPMFFLATADGEGRPDCSFKGGAPGFVRVTGVAELAFPSYDGNGMFRSLGTPYVPRAGYTPPVPKWKRFDEFADVLPRDDPARGDR